MSCNTHQDDWALNKHDIERFILQLPEIPTLPKLKPILRQKYGSWIDSVSDDAIF